MKTSRPRTTATVRAFTRSSIGKLLTCVENDFNRISCVGEDYFRAGLLSRHFRVGRPPGQPGRDPARLGVHLQHLFNRFRMAVGSFTKSLFYRSRDVVESDPALEKRGYCHFIGSI